MPSSSSSPSSYFPIVMASTTTVAALMTAVYTYYYLLANEPANDEKKAKHHPEGITIFATLDSQADPISQCLDSGNPDDFDRYFSKYTYTNDTGDTTDKQVLTIPKYQLGNLQPLRSGIDTLIGNTPMIELHSLSKATGCRVLAKMEMNNPGGSAKDRVALAIIEKAEREGLITPHKYGDIIFEGTSGSTGISLAMLCRAKGYNCHIALPDDTSIEKIMLLENLGATVYKVRPASIIDGNQYVNFARNKAEEINKYCKKVEKEYYEKKKQQQEQNSGDKNIEEEEFIRPPRALFSDQFENEANWQTHFENTGPEIYAQTQGNLDVFVTGAGTGGTISGVARYLKQGNRHLKKITQQQQSSSSTKKSQLRVILADPQGSGFYNRIKFGAMFSPTEKEGTRKRHQVDTIVEGIGLNRLTKNFLAGCDYIDDAVRVTDREALLMAKWLVSNDGVFIGSSSAVNAVAAYRCAKALGPGHTIVTLLCDSGSRHVSKFWKEAESLTPLSSLDEL